MKRKKHKNKPGAHSPASKNASTVLIEASSGSTIKEENTYTPMVVWSPRSPTTVVYFYGFTCPDGFVYHGKDSGDSKPLYIGNFLNGCTEAVTFGVKLDSKVSVCFNSFENEDATVCKLADRVDHTKSDTMDQVCLQSAGAVARSCTITDQELDSLLSWYGNTTQLGELWNTTNLKDIKKSVYQTLWSCISHFPEHYPCDHMHTRGLSLRCFTLKESIGMDRGASPPLDFVTRILSSKYWMLEADKWVDLLIICRWANPTTFSIKTTDVLCLICENEWMEPGNTSCGHTFCTDCLHDIFKKGCRECPRCQAAFEAKVYPNDSAKVLLIRYREERHSSEKRRFEYIPVKTGKRKREVDFCPHSIKKQCGSACGVSSPSQKDDSEPYFNKIYEVMFPARLKWFEIGLCLGIDYRELKVIKEENNGKYSTCLLETLIIQFETESPTVNDFIEAVENEIVNDKEVAKNLKNMKTICSLVS